ncbi:MAG: thioredoxin domain-containing protein [Propionibacterium sp.]|nr:thioredoxin domain-containing protein [Propionibacterium sp.]
MAERLAQASSPYLRQHASNPIDWWEWGPEPFAEAERRDLPVFVSIGYSSCHWCHVMAAETFSDPAVAALVNESFVAIKVDREEHPDVDQAFMRATQSLTGQGGWPNSVFCTPDGRPFFAGTYFPPQPRFGLPSFTQLIETLAAAWRERRPEVLGSASVIVKRLASLDRPPLLGVPDANLAPDRLLELVLAAMDPQHGGFGTAPKFPQAPVLDALFVRTEQTANDKALFALEAMARGGIHDQVGGGFHRYAVDEGWEVPHFEKMLYDNALLLGTYTRGWLRAIPDDGTEQREIFERVARGIVGWLADEMLLPGGGFAASLDADSDNEAGEHVEGAYYLWSPQLFDEYLGKDSRFAQGVFHVTYGGNLPRGAHAPADGSGLSTLQLHGLPHPGRLANIIAVLKAVRDRRPRPARDEKVLTAWNGLLVDSLVRAGVVFGQPEWLDLARACGQYLWRNHWDEQRRILARSSLATEEGISLGPDGVCSDYASAALGFLALAQLGDAVWLQRAVTLLDRALELFGADDGGFYETAVGGDVLFERTKRLSDEELPSATSIMEIALRAAARLAERPDLEDRADRAARALRPVLAQAPQLSGWGLASLLARSEADRGWGPAEIVIVGAAADPTSPLVKAAWRLAPWGSIVVDGPQETEGFGELFTGRAQLDGEPAAYVCRGQTCQLPVSDWSQLRALLWETD